MILHAPLCIFYERLCFAVVKEEELMIALSLIEWDKRYAIVMILSYYCRRSSPLGNVKINKLIFLAARVLVAITNIMSLELTLECGSVELPHPLCIVSNSYKCKMNQINMLIGILI